MFIQFLVFVVVYINFVATGFPIVPNLYALLLPVLIFILAALSLGFGIIISSMTTKYRNLKYLVAFGIQLWMYASLLFSIITLLFGILIFNKVERSFMDVI